VNSDDRPHPGVPAVVAGGGALGTLGRYGLARLIPLSAGTFPWATFWTNVTGCLALGVAVVLLRRRFPSNRLALPFVATGVLGGFTTYSTFALETALLAKDAHVPMALAYSAASLVAGFAALYAGLRLGGRLVDR
jgi:fluoride exporter